MKHCGMCDGKGYQDYYNGTQFCVHCNKEQKSFNQLQKQIKSVITKLEQYKEDEPLQSIQINKILEVLK